MVNGLDPTGQTVNVPGVGTMSSDDFKKWLQTNPNGSTSQPQTSGATSSNASGGGGNGGATNTPASSLGTNGASNSPFNTSSFGANLGGGNASARQENVYGLRSTDDPTTWAKRAFAQGTADFGPASMNPYLSQNSNANGPFQTWFQNRYGTAAPTNALVASELTGADPSAANMQGQMSSMMAGGAGGPATSAEAKTNLQGMNSLLNNFATNKSANNSNQNLFAGDLVNDPQLASQIITSQLQGSTGGWGMNYLGNQLSNLATQYYNDPANYGPQSPSGTYYNQALKMIGMA